MFVCRELYSFEFTGVTNPFFLKRLLQTQGKASNPAHVVYLAPEETRRNHQSRSFYPFSTDVELPPGFMPNETKGYIGKDWRFIKKLGDYLRGNEMSGKLTFPSLNKKKHYLT